MARMYPELTAKQLQGLKSRAEARFYEECRKQLSDDVVVIYSLPFAYRKDNKVSEGEADFAIVMPASGVIAVEVKGGGVALDPKSGEWSSVDRDGVKHEIKDPVRQAEKERHAIFDQLTGHVYWRHWSGKRLTMGHGALFPDIADVSKLVSPGRPREILGNSDDLFRLGGWLERIAKFWREPRHDALGAQGVKLVEEILCRPVEVRPALRRQLADAEQARIRLTNNQAKVLRIIGGRKRAVISGGAGTGKTLIALEKARQLAAMGDRTVLFLCYNRPLADALALAVRDEPKVKVMNFHVLCEQRIVDARKASGRDLMKEAEEEYPGTSDKHRFDVQMPYALALSNEVLDERFDSIVVDEAQDFSDDYWFAVEEMLTDPEHGSLYIFIDENQTLYRKHTNLPVKDEPYFLTTNCRNTAPIHQAGYVYYKGEPVDAPEMEGMPVEKLVAEDHNAQADAIARRVRRLITEEAVAPSEIAVLIARKPKSAMYELLRKRPLPDGVKWAIEAPGQERAVFVDTVARFKGLEAPVVVLWLGDDVVDEERWETVYVGTTRAKTLLAVVGSRRSLDALQCPPGGAFEAR